MDAVELIQGQKYDVASLRCVGWTGPGVYDEHGNRNPGLDAYDAGCYFTSEGEYKGPDDLGVEPIMETISG